MIDHIKQSVKLVKHWESYVREAYLPTPDDVWTIGYGKTEGVKEGDTLSEYGASDYLLRQLLHTAYRLEVELGDKWAPLRTGQKASLMSLAYNVDKDVMGQLKFSKAFKALKANNQPQFKVEAFSSVKGFVFQNGKVLMGLVNRRAAEWKLWDE